MDSAQTNLVIAAAIDLEMGAHHLYHYFAEIYPEDRTFWSDLQIEERNHASLLRAAQDGFTRHGILPDGILAESLEAMQEANRVISQTILECKQSAPTRKEACQLAIRLEELAGELHFNRFMSKAPESSLEEVFQQLNKDDKNHVERIREYMDWIED